MQVRDELVSLIERGIDWRLYSETDKFPVTRPPRPAAVLVLFGILDSVPAVHNSPLVPSDLDLLLLERAASLSHHPGQIAFPGGRIDPSDTDATMAALREAVEETGLDASGVDILGELPTIPLPVSHHEVTPVLGWWRRATPVSAVDPAESAHVFRVPVADLTDPANRRTATVRRGRSAMRSPAFILEGRLIWGFTGIVLARILEELGWTEPWDTDNEIQIPVFAPAK